MDASKLTHSIWVQLEPLNRLGDTYMCPDCFELFEVNTKMETLMPTKAILFTSREDAEDTMAWYDNHKPLIDIRLRMSCPKCKSGELNMVQIDKGLAETVRNFNLAGYQTMASCEGHWHEDGLTPYGTLPHIVFKAPKGIKNTLKKAIDLAGLDNYYDLTYYLSTKRWDLRSQYNGDGRFYGDKLEYLELKVKILNQLFDLSEELIIQSEFPK